MGPFHCYSGALSRFLVAGCVARRFVALSLGIYVIARNPNTRQRLWCTGDAINSHWRTIRDPFAESLRHAHSRRENRDEPISRNTSDRRVLRRHLENFLIYILPGLDVVSFKVIDEWMAFWLCGWERVWPFFSPFLEAIYPCRNGWDIYIPPLFF